MTPPTPDRRRTTTPTRRTTPRPPRSARSAPAGAIPRPRPRAASKGPRAASPRSHPAPPTATPPAAPPVTGQPQDTMSDAAVADLAASLAATEADETTAPDPASPAEDDSPVSSFFTRRSARIEATAPTPPPPGDEKQRMTVFGAREPVTSRGKPRYLGLILTAVLLLFLVAVAAWASVFLDDGIASLFRKDDQRQIVATPDIDLPEDDPEAQADAALTQPDDQPTAPPRRGPRPRPANHRRPGGPLRRRGARPLCRHRHLANGPRCPHRAGRPDARRFLPDLDRQPGQILRRGRPARPVPHTRRYAPRNPRRSARRGHPLSVRRSRAGRGHPRWCADPARRARLCRTSRADPAATARPPRGHRHRPAQR